MRLSAAVREQTRSHRTGVGTARGAFCYRCRIPLGGPPARRAYATAIGLATGRGYQYFCYGCIRKLHSEGHVHVCRGYHCSSIYTTYFRRRTGVRGLSQLFLYGSYLCDYHVGGMELPVCGTCGWICNSRSVVVDGRWQCRRCRLAEIASLKLTPLKSYNFTTTRAFDISLDTNCFYYGWELEMEIPSHECEHDWEDECDCPAHFSSPSRVAAKMVSGWDDDVIAKHDGSLENGLEIVSRPLPFEESCDLPHRFLRNKVGVISDYEITSWPCGRAGFHVHVSSAPMSEAWEANLNYFVYSNRLLFEHLGRRMGNRYCTYLNPTAEPYCEDKYVALNWRNHQTVEFRMFRGTLRPSSLRGYMDVVRAAIEFTKPMTRSIKAYTRPDEFCDYLAEHNYAQGLIENFDPSVQPVRMATSPHGSIFSGMTENRPEASFQPWMEYDPAEDPDDGPPSF